MKICPLKFIGYWSAPLNAEPLTEGAYNAFNMECSEGDCRWWTRIYTTELPHQEEDCALVILAKRNGDGRIPV